jgi:hypothetical protein
MLNKDNFFVGFVASMVATVGTYGTFYLINNILLPLAIHKTIFSEKFMMIISLGINVLVLRYFLNKNAYRSGRGIMLFVFIVTAYLIYRFFGEDLGLKD